MLDIIEFQGDRRHFPEPEIIRCSKQFGVEEQLVIPDPKPDIEQLLEVIVHPRIDKCKIIDTPLGKKLIINGHLKQQILYVADVPCQSVHSAHFTVPFCTFIEIPCSCSPVHHFENMCPRILIEYLMAKKVGPREITKCVILFLWFPKTSICPPCPQPQPHPHPQPHPRPQEPCDCRCNEIFDDGYIVRVKATGF